MARTAIAMIAALTFTAAGALAQPRHPLVYVVTSNQQFGTVDLETGAFTQIGPNTPEGQANLVWGPQSSLYSLTFSGNLERIDPATGRTTVVGQTGLFFNAFELAEVRGQLYATDFSNNLYSVDSATGAATLIGSTGVPADPAVPFTFNADGTMNLCDESLYGVGGKLYVTFDAFTLNPTTLGVTPAVNPALYEIDPHTGRATEVAPTLLNLGASIAVAGQYYGFRWIPTGFTSFGPQVVTELVALDLRDGSHAALALIDPAAGGIVGAAPVRNGR